MQLDRTAENSKSEGTSCQHTGTSAIFGTLYTAWACQADALSKYRAHMHAVHGYTLGSRQVADGLMLRQQSVHRAWAGQTGLG